MSRREEMLFHLVSRGDWARAEAAGTYTPPSLDAEGFIHFSTAAQLPVTAERFYAGRDDLLVVTVLAERLAAPLRFDPVDGDAFPHLYGPLNLDAVLEVRPWPLAPGR